MANQEQVRILKQGFEAWNKWREANPNVEIDLTEANLINTNFERANLQGANLIDDQSGWSLVDKIRQRKNCELYFDIIRVILRYNNSSLQV